MEKKSIEKIQLVLNIILRVLIIIILAFHLKQLITHFQEMTIDTTPTRFKMAILAMILNGIFILLTLISFIKIHKNIWVICLVALCGIFYVILKNVPFYDDNTAFSNKNQGGFTFLLAPSYYNAYGEKLEYNDTLTDLYYKLN